MNNLKSIYIRALQNIINENIGYIQNAMDSVIESKNGETKSSAGDKFETGRAMMQREQDQLDSQLYQAQQLKLQIETIPNQKESEIIGFGSIVQMNGMYYFLSVGLGRVKMDENTFYAISVESPIGKLVVGKQQNDTFTFNNKLYTITSVL